MDSGLLRSTALIRNFRLRTALRHGYASSSTRTSGPDQCGSCRSSAISLKSGGVKPSLPNSSLFAVAYSYSSAKFEYDAPVRVDPHSRRNGQTEIGASDALSCTYVVGVPVRWTLDDPV